MLHMVVVALSVALPALVAASGVADASSVGALQARAAQVGATVVVTGRQLHELAVGFEAASARVASAEAASEAATSALSAARARLGSAELAMRKVAVEEYTTGGLAGSSLAMFSSRGSVLGAREEYLSIASANQRQAVASMSEALALLAERRVAMRAATLAANGALEALVTRRQVLADRLAQENALLASDQNALVLARAQAAQAAALAAARAAAGPPASVSISLVAGSPSGSLAQDFARLRQCESGDDYQANTGNGYYGAYQFSLGTWQGLGYSGLPSQAPPSQQDQAAYRLYKQSGWSSWPACSAILGL